MQLFYRELVLKKNPQRELIGSAGSVVGLLVASVGICLRGELPGQAGCNLVVGSMRDPSFVCHLVRRRRWEVG
jgi:hypothetical protein